ncbi:MAG: hypothetical protein WC374_09260 [Phycisphaerae bacterium]|jgi:hypothetical protein
MLLNQKRTAAAAAVLAFFTVSIIAAAFKNCPFTCCKRALIAMAAAYFFTAITVKIINIILLDAIISKQLDKTLNRNVNRNSVSNAG